MYENWGKYIKNFLNIFNDLKRMVALKWESFSKVSTSHLFAFFKKGLGELIINISDTIFGSILNEMCTEKFWFK